MKENVHTIKCWNVVLELKVDNKPDKIIAQNGEIKGYYLMRSEDNRYFARVVVEMKKIHFYEKLELRYATKKEKITFNIIDQLKSTLLGTNVKRERECVCGEIKNVGAFDIDQVSYIYSENVLFITGWCSIKKSIRINDDSTFTFVKRTDVEKIYPSFNVMGFEKKIKVNRDIENGIVLVLGNYFIIYMSYLEIKRCLLRKMNEESLLLRYGKDGYEYKKNEFETLIKEYKINHYHHQEDLKTNLSMSKKGLIPLVSIVVDEKETKISDRVKTLFQNHVDTRYEVIINHGDFDSMKKKIHGRYIIFCDKMPTWLPEFWDKMFGTLRQKDLIAGNYSVYYQKDFICKVGRSAENLKEESFEYIFTALLIRRELVKGCHSKRELYEKICRVKQSKIEIIDKSGFSIELQRGTFIKNRLIAFYLPQFHITEENNEWWGDGFTEWTNVRRGEPQFKGHYQPRIPGKLGYYDLTKQDTQQKQIDLAKEYGVYGFCYYYYWFNGKKLLEKPLEQLLNNKKLDFPFCICWANETWSRKWDGNDHEILIKQEHNSKTDKEFILNILPILKDERYICVDGAPLILIYRIELFPEPARTIKKWREICRNNGIDNIYIAIVQSFDVIDNRIYGADAAVEFPPHKVAVTTVNEKMKEVINDDFEGSIYSYKELVDNMELVEKRGYEYLPGTMLNWDNTARKMKNAHIFTEFTPDLYKKWLLKNNIYSSIFNRSGYMFVNAWNEWAEGTYLEPDEKYGLKLLEITKEVLQTE